MIPIVELEGGIWQVDLEYCGHPGTTAGYLVRGDAGWMLIETGPASSAEKIFQAVKILGIKPPEVKYVAVTHIHLDHAGGLGVVAQHFSQAAVVVHYKSARHVIDPSRLIAGATAIWGQEKMQEFGEIVPVDEERVIPAGEGYRIDLGSRTIEVWDTPGHTKNHLCYYDAKTRGLFSGDAAGVYLPRLSETFGRPVVRPATPLPDFNGEKMLASLLRFALSDMDRVYYTHFGAAARPQLLIELVTGQLSVLLQLARKYVKSPDARNLLAGAIQRYIEKGLWGQAGSGEIKEPWAQNEWNFLTGILELNGAGILAYLEEVMR